MIRARDEGSGPGDPTGDGPPPSATWHPRTGTDAILGRGVHSREASDRWGRLRLARLGLVPRLMLLYGLLLAAALAVVLVVVSQVFVGQLARSLDRDLLEEIPEFGGAASQRPTGETLDAFAQQYVLTHTLSRGTALIVRVGGAAPAESAGALQHVPQIGEWLQQAPASTVLTSLTVAGQQYRVLASPIQVSGSTVGVLIATASLAGLQAQQREALLVTGLEAGAALLLTLLGTYLLLRRVLRTVDRVTVAARGISQDELGLRLGYVGADDEVGRLARTFDEMLDRIEAAFHAQQQLLSEASHQLRTPLTVIRGHLEVLRRSGYPDAAETDETIALVLDELTHTSALVDQLLLLGRSLEPGALDEEQVDLRSFMVDLYEAARAIAPRGWNLEPIPDAVVRVDRTALRGALLNLIDNAVKATAPGQAITLAARCDGQLVFSVADQGRGIPPGDQERLFERFTRSADAGTRGAGLGLAIVRAVAEAHGGAAQMESVPGRGTVVRIVLPAIRIETLDGVARSAEPARGAGAHLAPPALGRQ